MVTIQPCGLAGTALTANTVSLLATYSEKLCKPYCVNSSITPQYSVVYTTGTAVLNDSTVFVPVTAIITIVTPGSCSCNATTQLFTEQFEVAFQGQTALPTAVTVSNEGRTTAPANVKCCKASSYNIYDSITVAIA